MSGTSDRSNISRISASSRRSQITNRQFKSVTSIRGGTSECMPGMVTSRASEAAVLEAIASAVPSKKQIPAQNDNCLTIESCYIPRSTTTTSGRPTLSDRESRLQQRISGMRQKNMTNKLEPTIELVVSKRDSNNAWSQELPRITDQNSNQSLHSTSKIRRFLCSCLNP